uniref:Uncharacterized protein n=1 Tax=Cacopsylla melanoneura TaxID=428564 RepID=A0A8D9EV90_9HEMI
MASQILVPLGCLGVLLCFAYQVSAAEPKPVWFNYDPNYPKPKFKAPLTTWDGKDPCGSNGKPEICTTDIRTEILKQNDFEDKDFHAECTSDTILPEGVKTVCLLKKQRRSKATLMIERKTVLEIQVYEGKDKKTYARFSEPYEDD